MFVWYCLMFIEKYTCLKNLCSCFFSYSTFQHLLSRTFSPRKEKLNSLILLQNIMSGGAGGVRSLSISSPAPASPRPVRIRWRLSSETETQRREDRGIKLKPLGRDPCWSPGVEGAYGGIFTELGFFKSSFQWHRIVWNFLSTNRNFSKLRMCLIIVMRHTTLWNIV